MLLTDYIALNRMFRAPSVIFAEQASALQPVASARNPAITDAEEEAARGALNAERVARAEIYPYDRSTFDVWPIASRSGAASCECEFQRNWARPSRRNRASGRDRRRLSGSCSWQGWPSQIPVELSGFWLYWPVGRIASSAMKR